MSPASGAPLMSGRILIFSVVVLGGCAKPLEVGSITEIQNSTGSKSIDVLEPKRVAGQSSVPEFSGDQLLEVRTYADTESNGRVEVAGAQCELTASDFKAGMETPAKVRVPLYRNQSSTLAVACQKSGYRKKMITVTAMDVTRQQRMASGAGGGLLGVAVVAAFDAAADNTKNEWKYPIAAVILEPDVASKAGK